MRIYTHLSPHLSLSHVGSSPRESPSVYVGIRLPFCLSISNPYAMVADDRPKMVNRRWISVTPASWAIMTCITAADRLYSSQRKKFWGGGQREGGVAASALLGIPLL